MRMYNESIFSCLEIPLDCEVEVVGILPKPPLECLFADLDEGAKLPFMMRLMNEWNFSHFSQVWY